MYKRCDKLGRLKFQVVVANKINFATELEGRSLGRQEQSDTQSESTIHRIC